MGLRQIGCSIPSPANLEQWSVDPFCCSTPQTGSLSIHISFHFPSFSFLLSPFVTPILSWHPFIYCCPLISFLISSPTSLLFSFFLLHHFLTFSPPLSSPLLFCLNFCSPLLSYSYLILSCRFLLIFFSPLIASSKLYLQQRYGNNNIT